MRKILVILFCLFSVISFAQNSTKDTAWTCYTPMPPERTFDTIYSQQTWYNTSQWTASGAFLDSVDNGFIDIYGGTWGTFTAFATMPYYNQYMNWHVTYLVKVTAEAASSGIILGRRSVNVSFANDINVVIPLNTGGTNTFTIQGIQSGQTFATSGSNISYSLNDVLQVDIDLSLNVFTATVQNITAATSAVSVSKTWATPDPLGAGQYWPNSGQLVVYSQGGRQQIQSIIYTSNSIQNPAMLVLGDSRLKYHATTWNLGYADSLATNYPQLTQWCDESSGMREWLICKDAILDINPAVILMCVSSNDLRFGLTNAQVAAEVTSLVNTFQYHGIKTYLFLLPEDSTKAGAEGQGVIRNFLIANYSNIYIDNTWQVLSGGTGKLLPSLNDGNGIHLNNAGMDSAYHAFLEYGNYPYPATRLANVGRIGQSGALHGKNIALRTDYITRFSRATAGGGSGSPGGSNQQIQYNNSGAFGGVANLTWDATNVNLLNNTPLDLQSSGTNRSMLFENNNSGSDNDALVTFYPASGTNVLGGFEVGTKGTGAFGVQSQFFLDNSDRIADGTDFQTFGFRTVGTRGEIVTSHFGSKSAIPIMIASDYATNGSTNANQLLINTDGTVETNAGVMKADQGVRVTGFFFYGGFKDATPTKAYAIGLGVPGGSLGNDGIFSVYTGSVWNGVMKWANGGNIIAGTSLTDNSLALTQWVTTAQPQAAFVYDATHYATAQTNSSGNLAIVPTGNLTTFTGGIKTTGNFSYHAVSDGAKINSPGVTLTDPTATGSGNNYYGSYLGADVLAATNTGVSYSTVAEVYLAGGLTAGTNVTLPSYWSNVTLWVNSGATILGGGASTGDLQAQGGANWTFAFGTGAGTSGSPAATQTGSQTGGRIAITTSTSPAGSNATIMTATYHNNANYLNGSSVILLPENAAAIAASGATGVAAQGNASSFVLISGASALTQNTTYVWNYLVIGY